MAGTPEGVESRRPASAPTAPQAHPPAAAAMRLVRQAVSAEAREVEARGDVLAAVQGPLVAGEEGLTASDPLRA
jgi:hypothetical protein